MKICVLVKEVPDAAVEKRIDASTGRLDRSGEKNLNPFDTHAIEAAMQIKEGGAVDVDEVVAVTMGPESAVRALHKAVSLGADRSVHLTDAALAGSDVNGTGYALARVLADEQPDLVLLGQFDDLIEDSRLLFEPVVALEGLSDVPVRSVQQPQRSRPS